MAGHRVTPVRLPGLDMTACRGAYTAPSVWDGFDAARMTLCKTLGAAADDLVPFEKYAAATQGLTHPSSAARALYGGALHIERVDRLVQAVDEVVALVDAQLERKRMAQN
uniref:hypothetical protein n=1 Tax=Hylemonella sp. TaxID=2066020 RepID=UPI0026311DAA|nr:hypothetical protein [Hylemonella sp.]